MAGGSKDLHPKYRELYNTLKWPVLLYSVLSIGYVVSLPGEWVWFNWHPLAMMLCFITFAINAILIKKIGGHDNTETHGKILSAGILLCIFGWYVAETDEQFKLTEKTLHHKLGGITWLSYVLMGVGGFITLHPDYGIMRTNQTVRKFHHYGGKFLIALSWFVCVLGKDHVL